MLQQLSPDLFLIGFGQRSNLIQGFFEYFNHKIIYHRNEAVKPAVHPLSRINRPRSRSQLRFFSVSRLS